MNRIAASEHDLMTITRAIVGEGTGASVDPLLREGRALAGGLSPTAARLLKDTLAKGVFLQLVRRGGWRNQRRPGAGGAVTGRLWERYLPQPFRFSAFSIALLRWLTTEPLGTAQWKPLPEQPIPEAAADQLLLYLIFDVIGPGDLARTLAEQSAVRACGLVWLGFGDRLAATRCDGARPPSLGPLFSGTGPMALDALQGDLALRWIEMERRKRSLVDPVELERLGEVQGAALDALFAAADAARRRDLAGFVLEAVARLLPPHAPPDRWLGSLDRTVSVAKRTAARRAAGALLRAVRRWHAWTQEHRQVRFFEDGYELSQALLQRWEILGDAGYARSERVLAGLEALDASLED
jgi:FtsH ternary system-associated peptide